MNKREEQKAKRRVEILSSALDLFIKKGYSSTKITDIAKEVNMSVGLMFHYFESKEKLYEELISLGCNGLNIQLENDELSPIEIIASVADGILKLISSNSISAKIFVLMEQAKHNEGIPDSVREMIKDYNLIRDLIPLIEEGQRLGEIRDGNSLALSIALCSSIHGIAEEIALNPESPCPETMWLIDMISKN